jgi:iron uptake system EfeUOB component EfeO/EfeM
VKVAGTTLSAGEVAAAAAGAPVAAGPRPDLQPLPASAFRRPIGRYRAYSARQAAAMAVQVRALTAALRAGRRGAARRAWAAAYARYLRLGAAYGALGALDAAINGMPQEAHLRGLHRLERGLWTGERLSALLPWAVRLQADVRRLPRAVKRVEITPLDYATRAHEILEDAQRDMLSGQQAPWSGAGVRATGAALAATDAVLATLLPVLAGRDVLAPVQTGLAGLHRELDRLRRAHGGWPALGALSRREREQLGARLGAALERLALLPGALETTLPPAASEIRP